MAEEIFLLRAAMSARSASVGCDLCFSALRVLMSLCIEGEKLRMCLRLCPFGICLLDAVVMVWLKVLMASSMVL